MMIKVLIWKSKSNTKYVNILTGTPKGARRESIRPTYAGSLSEPYDDTDFDMEDTDRVVQ
jgi:hypothetical protein